MPKYCVDCVNKVYDSFREREECQAKEAEFFRNPVTGEWPLCCKMRGFKEGCSSEAKWHISKKSLL